MLQLGSKRLILVKSLSDADQNVAEVLKMR